MTKGILKVYLGAAPGVGKTFSMLEEGQRLRGQGRDIVIGLVETHGRTETIQMTDGLEIVPRRHVAHRSVELDELDIDVVIAREPEWALVDELAHTNAPGSANAKRWQDVQQLLDAGINVISTVNIQHIESLNDVVQSITGVVQRETIPDSVLRAADQVELVDLAPESLRHRLAGGHIYPAGTIDAALSNYFRLGNLTALRELALLWLADEVDVALQAYRNEHGIQGKWEARERVVVALPGGPEGETLIRRGARIAARTSGGQLLAVHVSSPDGLAEPDPAALITQRSLVESLGGSYHQVVGDRTPTALVDFARGVNATQLVIGVSRRSRFTAFLTGQGIGATVIRASGDIDVHIVSHASAGTLQLPRTTRGALTLRRRLVGFAVAVFGMPTLTFALTFLHNREALVIDVLSYQFLVVVVALVGGIWPAVTAAAIAGVTLDFFFVSPIYTVAIDDPLHLLALLIFLIVAVLVSLVVDQGASRSRAAKRSAAEAETLAAVAASIIRGENAVEALANRMREAFGLTSVTITHLGAVLYEASAAASAGTPGIAADEGKRTVVELANQGSVVLRGRDLQASDRRILDAFVAQIEVALVQRDLITEAEGLRPLEEADRLRTALLAAVGHDLRTPLSAATAAVSSLRSTDVAWTERDKDDLLSTAEVSLRRLAELVNDLLDASRLQAGVLAISLSAVGFDEIVPLALDELSIRNGEVRVDVQPDLPAVVCDPVLVQRVLVNLVANAIRYSPDDSPPIITASSFGDRVELRVIDRGPGIPQSALAEAFQPFQRLGDTDNTTGVGLGLALSNGFMDAMGGKLNAEDTPGGGLTMVISLPAVTAPDLERSE
ncbi:MAG: two-component system, OmpR family, sensor histidine kinase KdpD [Microbacteriaceae bacterium]|jgi:two-component system sensor histidine kinase KdpD|nr:sensor histidine kinase KdpD [Microbacteriaceae bacterium]MDQ1548427.1 two-component system, OmpR family, sensor histidine kinase KdpD [Microbacteriaceae bacterium]